MALRATYRLDDDSDERQAAVLVADPTFCLGHAYAAVVANEGAEDEKAQAELLAAARDSADRASDRERSYLAAAEAQVRDGYWTSTTEAAWRRHNADFPGDCLGLDQVLAYTYFGARSGTTAEAKGWSPGAGSVGAVAPVREQLD